MSFLISEIEIVLCLNVGMGFLLRANNLTGAHRNDNLFSVIKYSVDSLASKGEKIYKRIQSTLQSESSGKFAAIDIESKECFVSDTLLGAVMLARKAYPDRKFHIVRIGHRAAVSFKHRYKL